MNDAGQCCLAGCGLPCCNTVCGSYPCIMNEWQQCNGGSIMHVCARVPWCIRVVGCVMHVCSMALGMLQAGRCNLSIASANSQNCRSMQGCASRGEPVLGIKLVVSMAVDPAMMPAGRKTSTGLRSYCIWAYIAVRKMRNRLGDAADAAHNQAGCVAGCICLVPLAIWECTAAKQSCMEDGEVM